MQEVAEDQYQYEKYRRRHQPELAAGPVAGAGTLQPPPPRASYACLAAAVRRRAGPEVRSARMADGRMREGAMGRGTGFRGRVNVC